VGVERDVGDVPVEGRLVPGVVGRGVVRLVGPRVAEEGQKLERFRVLKPGG
jgi:hypothetical protein